MSANIHPQIHHPGRRDIVALVKGEIDHIQHLLPGRQYGCSQSKSYSLNNFLGRTKVLIALLESNPFGAEAVDPQSTISTLVRPEGDVCIDAHVFDACVWNGKHASWTSPPHFNPGLGPNPRCPSACGTRLSPSINRFSSPTLVRGTERVPPRPREVRSRSLPCMWRMNECGGRSASVGTVSGRERREERSTADLLPDTTWSLPMIPKAEPASRMREMTCGNETNAPMKTCS